jgi:hypothetical protein
MRMTSAFSVWSLSMVPALSDAAAVGVSDTTVARSG